MDSSNPLSEIAPYCKIKFHFLDTGLSSLIPMSGKEERTIVIFSPFWIFLVLCLICPGAGNLNFDR